MTSAVMDDSVIPRLPSAVAGILRDTEALEFHMVSEPKVGALLAVLAASKPGGRILELGTGTGHGTAWLLAGMDAAASLDTVDITVSLKNAGGIVSELDGDLSAIECQGIQRFAPEDDRGV